jgi:hypothetical protein
MAMIDTLATARNLEKRGFTQDQAEGLTEAMKSAVLDGSATKTDLIALDGKVSLLTWMIGVNLTLTLLVLGKLFFK